MENKIKIVIADDHRLFRKGLRSLLEKDPNIEVVGEAEDGAILMNMLEKLLVNIVLLDIKMPNLDGEESTRLIKEKFPHIKIIILSMYSDSSYVYHLVKNGANSYLLKDAQPEEVIEAIYKVDKDGLFFNSMVNRVLVEGLKSNPKSLLKPSDSIHLTDREKEVLGYICNQKTNQEIASMLYLSVRTVEGHRNNLLLKFGVKNTAGLVKEALKRNMIN